MSTSSSASDSSADNSSSSEPEVKVPIGQLLKKRKRTELKEQKKLTIDEQIAALEAEMQSDDSDSESSSEEAEKPMVLRTMLNEDDLIPALPSHMLPANFQRKRDKKQMKNTGSGLRDAVAEIMHTAGIKANNNLDGVREMVADYVPNSHKSLYCRCCKFTASTKEELLEHRQSSEHKAAAKLEMVASYCKPCRKQFTSPMQLKEHVTGKYHQETLQRFKCNKWTGYRSAKGSSQYRS